MRKQLENAKRLGTKLGLNEDRAFAAAVIVALLIVSVAVLSYFVFFAPQPEPYNSIYLLDQNKKALDYPQTLVVNQNSTFNTYVDIVNHVGKTASYRVEVKIIKSLSSSFPLEAPANQTIQINSLGDRKTSENTVTITENTIGSYSVVFELWQQKSAEIYEFAQNYCDLNIEVID